MPADVPLRDAAQAPTERWHVLPTGALLYGDDNGGITVAGLGAWQPCPERTAAIQALEALARAALAAADTTPDRGEIVERFRKALMQAHHHDWDMDTVSEAAHVCAEEVSSWAAR